MAVENGGRNREFDIQIVSEVDDVPFIAITITHDDSDVLDILVTSVSEAEFLLSELTDAVTTLKANQE